MGPHRRSFGISRAIKLHIDPFEHCVEITRYLGIPESDHAIPFLFKPILANAITRAFVVFVMMPAIKFDDELPGRTEEINDIGTDRGLSAEVRSFHRKLLESSPKHALMRRCISA